MKQYKYRGFENPIIVDDDGKATYRGHEIEKYCHGYKTVGIGSGFSYNQLAKSHYIREMERIDEKIRQEEYREAHKEEFERLLHIHSKSMIYDNSCPYCGEYIDEDNRICPNCGESLERFLGDYEE